MESAFDYKTRKEERWNAITHGIGVLFSIPALVFLIIKGVQQENTLALISYIIFGVSMILLYTMSTLLHSLPERFKKLFSIFDHSAIYFLIAGTYTPLVLLAIGGGFGWTLFGIVWGLAIFGTLFKVFFIHRFEKVSLVLYILMGWLIIIAIKPLYETLTGTGIVLLVVGGMLYTLGALVYAWRSLPYNHAIWHLFVLAGSASMYFSVLFFV
ncbi:PAQR family membrane homeostasis protein TrhA [Sporosarcina gallistercoris]|uniref:Hemolysin III family protein n=1 Tax=Sporosarcina gallistercoris TaxID=2762245 RepID=A0ABR8PJJ7_9BACL|nr:hemolysin III family protein [Sporosarcina gallistercoris]MBD7908331.1 hemolysin III family protein [Sporosarcina gallistercoris]